MGVRTTDLPELPQHPAWFEPILNLCHTAQSLKGLPGRALQTLAPAASAGVSFTLLEGSPAKAGSCSPGTHRKLIDTRTVALFLGFINYQVVSHRDFFSQFP